MLRRTASADDTQPIGSCRSGRSAGDRDGSAKGCHTLGSCLGVRAASNNRSGSKAGRGSSEAEQRRATAHVRPGHQKGRSVSFCTSTPVDNERCARSGGASRRPMAGANIPSAGRGVRPVFHYLRQHFFTYLAQFSLSVSPDTVDGHISGETGPSQARLASRCGCIS